jgi:hypothetical protein
MIRKLRRAKRVSVVRSCAITAAAPLVFVLVFNSAASAATCPKGYQYSGQITDNYWQGLEGMINNPPSQELTGSNSHIYLYNNLEAKAPNMTDCLNLNSLCFSQAGVAFGAGVTGTSCAYVSVPTVYWEKSDINGYTCDTFPSLTDDATEIIYNTGVSNGESDEIGAVNVGPGPDDTTLGFAWIPDDLWQDMYAISTAEIDTESAETCPSIGEYAQFGSDGDGNVNSGTQFELFNGSSWYQWLPEYPTMQYNPSSYYSWSPFNGDSYFAFKSWGGG